MPPRHLPRLVAVAAAVTAAACSADAPVVSDPPGSEASRWQPVATVDGHPGADRHPHGATVEIAYDTAAADALLDLVGVDTPPEGVADGSHVLVAYRGYQSSTCPQTVTDLRVDDDATPSVQVTTETSGTLGGCTDDAVGYTQLGTLPRGQAPDPEQLPLDGDAEAVLATGETVTGDEPDQGIVDAVLHVQRRGRTWTVDCRAGEVTGAAPARVDVAAACQAADEHRSLLTDGITGDVCTQEYGGPQEAEVTGHVDGDDVAVSLHRRDGCGISAWQQLADLLGNPDPR